MNIAPRRLPVVEERAHIVALWLQLFLDDRAFSSSPDVRFNARPQDAPFSPVAFSITTDPRRAAFAQLLCDTADPCFISIKSIRSATDLNGQYWAYIHEPLKPFIELFDELDRMIQGPALAYMFEALSQGHGPSEEPDAFSDAEALMETETKQIVKLAEAVRAFSERTQIDVQMRFVEGLSRGQEGDPVVSSLEWATITDSEAIEALLARIPPLETFTR